MSTETKTMLEAYQKALKEFENTTAEGERLYARKSKMEEQVEQMEGKLANLQKDRQTAMDRFAEHGDSGDLDRLNTEIAQADKDLAQLKEGIAHIQASLDALKEDLYADEKFLQQMARGHWDEVEEQVLAKLGEAVAPMVAEAHRAYFAAGHRLSLNDYWADRVFSETGLYHTVPDVALEDGPVPVRPPEVAYYLLSSQERSNIRHYGKIKPEPVKAYRGPIITDEHGRPSNGVPH